MTLQRHRIRFERLPAERLAAWRDIATAVISDCLNRGRAMAAAIKPLAPGTRLLGQARTVAGMVGDNAAAHAAIGLARPGEVLVIDARGHEGAAVWGGIMTRAALARGIAGAVIDGAVRDVAEIRASGFPCFARAAVPAGPHKGFGGVIDGPISCGGCPVRPGDLVIGDDDGVVVVPLEREAALREAVARQIEREKALEDGIAEGTLPAEQMGIAAPDWLD